MIQANFSGGGLFFDLGLLLLRAVDRKTEHPARIADDNWGRVNLKFLLCYLKFTLTLMALG